MKRVARKNSIFTMRLTAEQMKALKKAAQQQGKKPSDMVRDLVLGEIGRQAVAA